MATKNYNIDFPQNKKRGAPLGGFKNCSEEQYLLICRANFSKQFFNILLPSAENSHPCLTKKDFMEKDVASFFYRRPA